MSAKARKSVFGQAIASRTICMPRSPAPMIPSRSLSLAPRTLETASVPARPEATLPMKLRRDCIALLLIGWLAIRMVALHEFGAATVMEPGVRLESGHWKGGAGDSPAASGHANRPLGANLSRVDGFSRTQRPLGVSFPQAGL